ncbi:MAG: type 1 glutamine amidotransferase [Nanoarchaeota archaeon]
MKLAISMKQDYDKHGAERSVLEDAYNEYFRQFGLILFPISNSVLDISSYLKEAGVEGIILSGGNDIDPQSYGGERTDGLSLALKRDKVEKTMLEYAIKNGLPVLGICRGMQFLNVYYGGKIIDFREKGIFHPAGKEQIHKVVIIHHQEVLGTEVKVNSYHNQGITQKELSSSLRVFALSEEGIVEGFYHPSLPIVGVQWHPERDSPDEMFNEKLVEAFVKGEGWWKR